MPLPNKKGKKPLKGGKSYPVPPRFNPNRNPMKPSTGNVLGYVKGANAVVNTAAKYGSGLIGGMKMADVARSIAPSVGRAAKAAGKSLLKDYQGSGIQQRFEGTPITVETKFETEPSPTIRYPEQKKVPHKYPKTDAFRNRQAHGRTPPRVDVPDHDKYWMFPR
tara:strand:- start:729 stop:1220 length:492 start_codon:yes stop_codon:yes gene_type:complete